MSTLKPYEERYPKLRKGLKNDFDAIDLRIFLNIDEAANLTDIALKLGVTKSAISMRIDKLEKIFEIALVQHNPIRLTAAGEYLRNYALETDRLKRKLFLDVAGLKSNDGILRIIAISSVLIDDANPIIAKTQSEFLHLNASLIEGSYTKIIEYVESGKAEIGLIGKEAKIEGLIFEKYKTTQAVLLMHAEHPLATIPTAKLSLVEQYRVVALPSVNLLTLRLNAAQMSTGTLIRPHFVAADLEIAAHFASTTPMGLTITLEEVAKRHAATHGSKIVYFSEPWKYFDLFTVTRAIELRSDAMTYFITKLRQKYR